MQNMETLLAWTTQFVVTLTVRQRSRHSIERTEEANAGV
jgi:hypothetical protein